VQQLGVVCYSAKEIETEASRSKAEPKQSKGVESAPEQAKAAEPEQAKTVESEQSAGVHPSQPVRLCIVQGVMAAQSRCMTLKYLLYSPFKEWSNLWYYREGSSLLI